MVERTDAAAKRFEMNCAFGTENMALDVELLVSAENSKSGFRLYTWNGPWVSLGHYQNPETALLEANCVPFVVRPTGGRAVLHGHDLTIAVALPLKDEDTRKLRTVYRAIICPIIEGLNHAGIEAVLGEEILTAKQNAKSSDCFAHISANDVVDAKTRNKICGCALRITENAVLLQASIPMFEPLVDPKTVYKNAATPTPLNKDINELANAISESLARFLHQKDGAVRG